MSWSIARCGTGAEVAAAIQKELNSIAAQGQMVPATLGPLAEAFGATYPEKQVTFETTGHLDSNYGSFEVKARVWPSL